MSEEVMFELVVAAEVVEEGCVCDDKIECTIMRRIRTNIPPLTWHL